MHYLTTHPGTWVGIAAVIVAAVALFVSVKSARAAGRSAKAAERSANAAERSAAAGERSSTAAERSAAAGERSSTAAERSSVAAERSSAAAERSSAAAERGAAAAEEQTNFQQQLRIESAQPFVWADLRPDDATGTIVNLVIGNSGPTVARNIRATIDPPLPTIPELRERMEAAQRQLADGVAALPPGRTLTWPIGQGFNILNASGPLEHTFTITAEGPFGEVPPLIYTLNLADLRGVLDRPTGSLHLLTKAVESIRFPVPAPHDPDYDGT